MKTRRHRRENGQGKTQAEKGVMLPQASGHLELAEAGRGKEQFPKSLRREHSLANTLILGF